MRTLVKNGTIVTADSEYKADILIVDEKIAAIGTNLEGPFDKVLDAEGKYILPGGVDNHAHFEALNTDGITTNEPYATTWVALQGGTTTIVDFCTNVPGMNLVDSVNYRLNVRAKGKVAPDIAIHACCNDFTDETVGEIRKLVEMGVPEGEDLRERLLRWGRLVLDTAGIAGWRMVGEESSVYGETDDFVDANGMELASSAVGPHPLDAPWGIMENWVGIGFGLERLCMAATGESNTARAGRSLAYINGIRLHL